METLFILIIFVGVIALIASPFIRATTEVWEASAIDSKMNRLAAAKESHYKAIKDVDFEYAEGKLSEKDYNELRGYYKEKAIMTVKEMEKIKTSQPKAAGSQQSAVSSHKKDKKEHR